MVLNYRAPWWLPGGNLQTIAPALFAKRVQAEPVQYQRERWATPDGDFIDVDFLQPPPSPSATAPRSSANMGAKIGECSKDILVLFHGLEGSSRSHYAEAFADWARAQGMGFAVPHFRGCSGELNHAPRAYHSGDFAEIAWVLQRLRARMDVQHGVGQGRIMAVGISLGGNALLRWAQELGAAAAQVVSAVASVCSPIDLAASGQAIGRGFNRLVYTRMFLRSMKPKALRKWAQHPGLFDRAALLAARNLYEFDNVFTAPLHGFKNTEDYWARASAKPQLQRIRIPALVVNARNDPFVPASCLPQTELVGGYVRLWQPAQGGHVGFAAGGFPGHLQALPQTVGTWLAQPDAQPQPLSELSHG